MSSKSGDPAFIQTAFLVFTILVAENEKSFLMIHRIEAMSWLVHGFGTSEWGEKDFTRDENLKNFRVVLMNQLHSDIVHRIEAAPKEQLSGDALLTDKPGLLLVIKSADCLPVLVVDERKKVVAAAHCGWRSTEAKILDRVVECMRRSFGSLPGDLIAALGPCIGFECYEVERDICDLFETAGFPPGIFSRQPERPDKFLLNLRGANIWLLEKAGLRKENIISIDSCTFCDDRLFSFRRDGDGDSRMFSFIAKK